MLQSFPQNSTGQPVDSPAQRENAFAVQIY